MGKFEHQIKYLKLEQFHEIIPFLNQEGSKGWELIHIETSIKSEDLNDGKEILLFFFKRSLDNVPLIKIKDSKKIIPSKISIPGSDKISIDKDNNV